MTSSYRLGNATTRSWGRVSTEPIRPRHLGVPWKEMSGDSEVTSVSTSSRRIEIVSVITVRLYEAVDSNVW
jgi:hypothetical protein